MKTVNIDILKYFVILILSENEIKPILNWGGIPCTDWIIAFGTFGTVITLIILWKNSKKEHNLRKGEIKDQEIAGENNLIDLLEYVKNIMQLI